MSNLSTGIKGGGIAGIERNIENRLNSQDKRIQESFQDLSKLMNYAKEMVTLSQTITETLNKKSDLNEADEELTKLKSCLLNMGIIDNPVTKDSSGSKYHHDLALEIYRTLRNKIRECGGLMTLSDVYCRINRARGMAGLLSPEDLFNACKEFNKLNTEIKYVSYKESNLHVLQINELIENNERLEEICQLIKKNNCLSADKLSKLLNCNSLVAKLQLLYGESVGRLCRDDTSSGLYFYINLFL